MFPGFTIPELLIKAAILLISLPIHELAHAYTANAFGDDTPAMNGRLSLNPLAHLDPFGSLLILVAGFGWAKPVPINPYVLKRRSSAAVMWVSLAGPFSNFLQALIATIPIRLGLVSNVPSTSRLLPTPYEFLIGFIGINLLLAVFNLIPLAPLDGEKILEFLLPPDLARGFERIRPYSMAILLALVFLLPLLHVDVLGMVIYPVINTLMRAMGV
jgi:Zn-dependent protease